jgi:hypothetical protein
MSLGALAEYETPEAIVAAAAELLRHGLRRIDAYTPYPLADLEDAIAIPRSRIPIVTLLAGLLGACVGYGLQWFCNSFDYPIPVGGRPMHPVLAYVPITFETTVLFAGTATFLAFFAAARLPEIASPIFDVPGFDRAVVDRFWLAVDASDPAFDPEQTWALLESTRPLSLHRPERWR